MKKCKWCESQIENNATICPYCKASQSGNTNELPKPNHIKNYVKSDSNKNQLNDDIHQIAQDLRFIKKLIIIGLILSVILGFMSGLNIL